MGRVENSLAPTAAPQQPPQKWPLRHYNAGQLQNPNNDLRTFSISIPKKAKKPPRRVAKCKIRLAPRPGLEPGTCGLTVQVTGRVSRRILTYFSLPSSSSEPMANRLFDIAQTLLLHSIQINAVQNFSRTQKRTLPKIAGVRKFRLSKKWPLGTPLGAGMAVSDLGFERNSDQISTIFSIDFSFMGMRYCVQCLWNSYP